LLEKNKAILEAEPKPEGFAGPEDFPFGLPGGTPLGSPSLSDAEGPEGSPPAGSGGDDGELMEFYDDVSDSDEDAKDVKAECKEELKIETKVEVKEETLIKEETMIKEELKVEEKKGGRNKFKAEEVKAAVEISLDSDDEVKDEVIDSEDSVHDIDSCEEESDGVYESLSSGCDSDSDGVEYVDSSFKAPSVAGSLRMVSDHFVFRCLGTLFMRRGPLWAKPKIDAFFQDVFYRRSIFTPAQQAQVEAWQSRIKVMQKNGERDVGDANNPMEAHRPVVDSREMRTSIESAGGEWAAKQTFDSRESKPGGVIR